jgi:hypothetical protein
LTEKTADQVTWQTARTEITVIANLEGIRFPPTEMLFPEMAIYPYLLFCIAAFPDDTPL